MFLALFNSCIYCHYSTTVIATIKQSHQCYLTAILVAHLQFRQAIFISEKHKCPIVPIAIKIYFLIEKISVFH